MGKMTIIILTKSSKYSNYCVAGIEYPSGKWVRLVTEDLESHGAIKKGDLVDERGREFEILDILRVPVLRATNDNIVQPENVLIDKSKSVYSMGKTTIEQVLTVHAAEKKDYILGNIYSRITEWKESTGIKELAII